VQLVNPLPFSLLPPVQKFLLKSAFISGSKCLGRKRLRSLAVAGSTDRSILVRVSNMWYTVRELGRRVINAPNTQASRRR